MLDRREFPKPFPKVSFQDEKMLIDGKFWNTITDFKLEKTPEPFYYLNLRMLVSVDDSHTCVNDGSIRIGDKVIRPKD